MLQKYKIYIYKYNKQYIKVKTSDYTRVYVGSTNVK